MRKVKGPEEKKKERKKEREITPLIMATTFVQQAFELLATVSQSEMVYPYYGEASS